MVAHLLLPAALALRPSAERGLSRRDATGLVAAATGSLWLPVPAARADSQLAASWTATDGFSDKNFISFEESAYAAMRDDEGRTPIFEKAIQKRLAGQEGKLTVLEIGTGPYALLAIIAARAGAKKVYAIEAQPEAAKRARQAVMKAGFEDTIEVLEGFSTAVELPEKADVVVAEIVGSVASEEGMIATIRDAQARLVKQPELASSWIPNRCQTLAAPATYALHYALGPPQFDWTKLKEPVRLNCRDETLQTLAEPQLLEDISFADLSLPASGTWRPQAPHPTPPPPAHSPTLPPHNLPGRTPPWPPPRAYCTRPIAVDCVTCPRRRAGGARLVRGLGRADRGQPGQVRRRAATTPRPRLRPCPCHAPQPHGAPGQVLRRAAQGGCQGGRGPAALGRRRAQPLGPRSLAAAADGRGGLARRRLARPARRAPQVALADRPAAALRAAAARRRGRHGRAPRGSRARARGGGAAEVLAPRRDSPESQPLSAVWPMSCPPTSFIRLLYQTDMTRRLIHMEERAEGRGGDEEIYHTAHGALYSASNRPWSRENRQKNLEDLQAGAAITIA